jgi:phasin
MLLLLLKGYWWAAWWPYSTWLLAVDKALCRMNQGCDPPQHQTNDEEQVSIRESAMANDAFVKPEIPESMRDLMKMSIEQAKRAFDTFASTSEKTWKSLETGSQSARVGLTALNAKIAEITRENAEANFALALKLTDTKDLNQAFDLQTQHARKQMETFVHQLEELRDLASQIIQESGATAAAVSKQAAQEMASVTSQAPTAPSYTSSSYAAAGGRRGN